MTDCDKENCVPTLSTSPLLPRSKVIVFPRSPANAKQENRIRSPCAELDANRMHSFAPPVPRKVETRASQQLRKSVEIEDVGSDFAIFNLVRTGGRSPIIERRNNSVQEVGIEDDIECFTVMTAESSADLDNQAFPEDGDSVLTGDTEEPSADRTDGTPESPSPELSHPFASSPLVCTGSPTTDTTSPLSTAPHTKVDGDCAACLQFDFELQVLRRQVTEKDKYIRKLESEVINIGEDAKAYQAEFDRIQEEGKKLYMQYITKTSRLKDITDKYNDLKGLVQQKDDEVAALKKRLAEEEEKVNKWKQKFKAQGEKFKANFTSYKALKEECEMRRGLEAAKDAEISRLRALLADCGGVVPPDSMSTSTVNAPLVLISKPSQEEKATDTADLVATADSPASPQDPGVAEDESLVIINCVLRDENEALRSELSQAEAASRQLEREIASLVAAMQDKERERAQWESRAEQHRLLAEDERRAAADIAQRLEQVSTCLRTVEADLTASVEREAVLRRTIEERVAENLTLQSDLKRVYYRHQKELEELSAKYRHEQYKEKYDHVVGEKADLLARLSALTALVDDVKVGQRAYAELQYAYGDIATSMAACAEDLQAAQLALAARAAEYDRANKVAAQCRAEVDSLKAALAAVECDRELAVMQREEQIGRYRTAMGRLEEDLVHAHATIATLTASEESLRRSLRNTEHALVECQARAVAEHVVTMATLIAKERSLETANRQLAVFNEEVCRQKDEQIAQLESELSRLRDMNEFLESEKAIREDEYEATVRHMHEAEARLAEELRVSMATTEQLRGDLVATQQGLDQALATASEHCLKATALEQRLTACTEELTTAQRCLAEAHTSIGQLHQQLIDKTALTEELSRRLEAAVAATAAAEAEARRTRMSLAEASMRLAIIPQLEARITREKMRSEEHRNDLEKAGARIGALEEQLRKLAAEKEVVELQKEQLVLQLDLLLLECDRASLAAGGESIQMLNEKFVLERELAETRLRYDEATKRAEQLSKEVEIVKAYLVQFKQRSEEKVSVLQDNLQKAEAEVEMLDRLLNGVRRALVSQREAIRDNRELMLVMESLDVMPAA